MRLSVAVRAVVVPILAAIALFFLIKSSAVPFAKAGILVVAFILFVDFATLAKRGLQNALVVLSTLALGLGVIEAYAEFRMPQIKENRKAEALYPSDPNLGYHANRPGVVPAEKIVDGHLSYRVAYTIDDGLRRLTRSPENGVRIRFFGDSYTFGEGLDDPDTLPQLFADMTGANVLNFGYPGYSPAQVLRALQLGLYDKDLEGSKLLIMQTGPYHVERTACLPAYSARAPRYVLVSGKVELKGKCTPALGQSSGIYRALLQPALQRLERGDVETYIAIVNAITDLARSKYHVPLLILDMTYDGGDFDKLGFTKDVIEARFLQAGAMVLDDTIPATPEQRALPYDGHPTALANKLMARRTVDFLAKEKPDLLKPPAGGTAVSQAPSGQ